MQFANEPGVIGCYGGSALCVKFGNSREWLDWQPWLGDNRGGCRDDAGEGWAWGETTARSG